MILSNRNNKKIHHFDKDMGFSILEVIFTMALMAVLTGYAVNELKALDNPLKNASADVQSFIKQVRAKAISTTSAYTIFVNSSDEIVTAYADNCNETTVTTDPQLTYNLPNGADLSDLTWSVCFNSRGLPDANIEILLHDADGVTKTIEVFLGGAVKEV